MSSTHELDTFKREIGELLKKKYRMGPPISLEFACVALFESGVSAQTIKETHLPLLVKIQDMTEGTDSIVTGLIARVKNKVTARSVSTSRGLSAGSSDVARSLDSADKPRNVGADEEYEQLQNKISKDTSGSAVLDVELSKELSNIAINITKETTPAEERMKLLLAAHLTEYEEVYKEIANNTDTEEKKASFALALLDLTASKILQQISSEDYKKTIVMSLARSTRPDWIVADLKKIIGTYSPVTDRNIMSLLPYITAPGFGIAELIVDLSCPECNLDKIISHINAVKNINDSSKIRGVIKLLCETVPSSKSHIIDNLELLNTDHEIPTKNVDQFFDRLCNVSQNPDIGLVKFYLDTFNLKLAKGEKLTNTHDAHFNMVKNIIGLSNILREKEYLDEEIFDVLHFVIAQEKSGNKLADFLKMHNATTLDHFSDINKVDHEVRASLFQKIHGEQENKVDALKTFYLVGCENKLYGQTLTDVLLKVDEIYPTVIPSFNRAMLGLLKDSLNEKKLGMFSSKNELAFLCSELNEIEKKNDSVLENVDEEKRGVYVLQSFLSGEPLLNILEESLHKGSEMDSVEPTHGVKNN